MLSMHKQVTIKTLKKQGFKNIRIARVVGCCDDTVKNVLDRPEVVSRQTRNKSSTFDPFKDRIGEYLDKGVKMARIAAILRDEGVSANYFALTKFVSTHNLKSHTPYVVQEVAPGEIVELDFGQLGSIKDPATGKHIVVWGFAAILAYSRYTYFAAVTDMKVETLITLMENAFAQFCGTPKTVKPDNLKAAVLSNRHYDLTLNKSFLEYAYHGNFVIAPTSPHSPWQKGKVERSMGYMQTSFWSERVFADLSDVRRQLQEWSIEANARIHGTTKKVPVHVFESEEKSTLSSLPDFPFAIPEAPSRRTVKPNCHISFNSNYYSVPYKYVGCQVEAITSGSLLRIYEGSASGSEIAVHAISSERGRYITQKSHYPDGSICSSTDFQLKWEKKMSSIGSHSLQCFTYLLKNDPQRWRSFVRGIQGLTNAYCKEAVEAAVARSFSYGNTSPHSIKTIIEQGLATTEGEGKVKLINYTPLLLPINESERIVKVPDYSRELSYYQFA
jgi:transposase